MITTARSKYAAHDSSSRLGSGIRGGALAGRGRVAGVLAPMVVPVRAGARTLFAVPFVSAMGDPDIAVLARTLDLVTHMHPKLHDSPTSPGVVRLDFHSGLFLKRGPDERHWVLEGRAWGDPSLSIVHDWHVRAAAAAHRLDPSVPTPTRPRAPMT